MYKLVLLSCLLATALARPHHTSTHHQHDAEEAKPLAADTPAKPQADTQSKPQAAETQAKPQESEKPAETKPEEHKEAEASKPEAAKPAEVSSDTVRKDEHKETPVVPVVPVAPLEHAVEHAAEPKPVRS